MEINQEEWEARLGADLSRVCRLCLKTCEAFHPIFNFNEPENGQTLSHKIMACAQVKVFEGDGLPTHVCNSCFSQVDRSYQFKLLCERSDSKLRGSIVSMNGSSDTDEVDSDEVDMTQLTPEVIIDEEPSTPLITQDGGHRPAESNGDLYGKIMQSVLDANTSQNNNTSTPPRQPKYLQGLPGFVHSNQEMARMAVAMALHQRSIQDQQRKAEEKQREVQAQIKQQQYLLRQKRAKEEALSGPSPKSRRCRNGVKAFTCAQCNKSYSFSSALSRHKAVHNPHLRPHFCTICKRGFTQVDKLLRHQRTHALDSAALFNATMAYNNKIANSYLGLSAQTSSSSLPLSLSMKPLLQQSDSTDMNVHRFLKTERREVKCTSNQSVTPSLSKLLLLKSKISKEHDQIDLPPVEAEHLEISIKPEHLYPDSDDIDDDDDDVDEQDVKGESIKSEEIETSIQIKEEIDQIEIKSETVSDDQVIDIDRGEELAETEDAVEKASYPPPTGKGKAEFRCPVCLKCFATRGSLDVHSTIHTGVRPFICKICQQAFRHKVNLIEHFQRKHSQVRPYHCDVCASRFVTKQELLRHYRKHISE